MKSCAGSAEVFIKLDCSLQTLIKGKICDSEKAKFDTTGVIIYSNPKDIWNTITTKYVSCILL